MEKRMVLTKSGLIDYHEALTRMGGDELFLYELLEDFITEFKEYYQAIIDAVLQNDFDVISEMGHTLKGSSAMLSLVSMNNLSAQLERAGRSSDMGKVKDLVRQMRNEFSDIENLFSGSYSSAN